MGARVATGLLLVTLSGGGAAGYGLLRTSIEAEVYRTRLQDVTQDFEQLRERYDEAVRRTAVTELIVHDERLDVVIRSAAGELERIETPFDPSGEIYVDFLVREGRLWIRRIFDAKTPPATGMVIDPQLGEVDWTAADASYGKATYRALGEGRWVVSVSGDGSLGLERRDTAESAELAHAPSVRAYAPVGEAVDDRLGALEPLEILRVLGRRVGATP